MKKKFVKNLSWLILVIALSLTFLFTSCSEPEETYLVITDTLSLYEAASIFDFDIEDGYYYMAQYTEENAQKIWEAVDSSYKHRWTEEKITKYFKGIGMLPSHAEKLSAYLVTHDYAMAIFRDGGRVYYIMIYS